MKADAWPSAVVAYLADCKREGLPHEAAWRDAMRVYPPPGNGSESTLFDDRGEPHGTLVGFLKRVSRDAYEDRVGPVGSGSGPALRGFRADMLMVLDMSGPAVRQRRAA